MPAAGDALIGEAELHGWAVGALTAAGARERDAGQIARCLVDVDLRGVKSHGTRQLQKYTHELAGGEINPAPTIRTLKETPSSVRLDKSSQKTGVFGGGGGEGGGGDGGG